MCVCLCVILSAQCPLHGPIIARDDLGNPVDAHRTSPDPDTDHSTSQPSVTTSGMCTTTVSLCPSLLCFMWRVLSGQPHKLILWLRKFHLHHQYTDILPSRLQCAHQYTNIGICIAVCRWCQYDKGQNWSWICQHQPPYYQHWDYWSELLEITRVIYQWLLE